MISTMPHAYQQLQTLVIPRSRNDFMELWEYKGQIYLRTSYNELWKWIMNVGCGAWCGVYLPAEDRIDTTALEPIFEVDESAKHEVIIDIPKPYYCPECAAPLDLNDGEYGCNC